MSERERRHRVGRVHKNWFGVFIALIQGFLVSLHGLSVFRKEKCSVA